jgi:ethanolamine utilization protein EutQ
MPRLIAAPVVIEAAGTKPKLIEEFVGHPSTGTATVSVARMRSPAGWEEPGQRPEFLDVAAGQAVVTAPGEWVRYSTPHPDGAEYVAICLPAFSPQTVHRDA